MRMTSRSRSCRAARHASSFEASSVRIACVTAPVTVASSSASGWRSSYPAGGGGAMPLSGDRLLDAAVHDVQDRGAEEGEQAGGGAAAVAIEVGQPAQRDEPGLGHDVVGVDLGASRGPSLKAACARRSGENLSTTQPRLSRSPRIACWTCCVVSGAPAMSAILSHRVRRSRAARIQSCRRPTR